MWHYHCFPSNCLFQDNKTLFSYTNMLLIIAFLHTKQSFNSAWVSKEEIMDASEDRLSNVLCSEQACNAFRSLSQKIQSLCNMCVRGLSVFPWCFFSLPVLQQTRWHVFSRIQGDIWRWRYVVTHPTRFSYLAFRRSTLKMQTFINTRKENK